MLKSSVVLAIAVTMALQVPGFASDKKIPLFESTGVVRKFLAGKTQHDYTEFDLTRVSLEFIDDSSKSGLAYAYFFNRREAGTGSGLMIYHFMDGTILERTFGP